MPRPEQKKEPETVSELAFTTPTPGNPWNNPRSPKLTGAVHTVNTGGMAWPGSQPPLQIHLPPEMDHDLRRSRVTMMARIHFLDDDEDEPRPSPGGF